MAITYSYKIIRLLKAPSLDGLSDVITNVEFTYTGVDENGYSGSFNGAVPMPAPISGSFTDLNSLTENDVIGWVQIHHPTDHMEEVIEAEINEQLIPTKQEVTGSSLPWI